MTGVLLKTVLGWFQFNAGISFCVLANPSPATPYLEGYWLSSVRTFLASIHGSLEFMDNQIQPTQREGDTYLMDIALASKLTLQELCGINLCRLFFNALTTSDITNASGNCLSPGILDGTFLISQSRPKGPRVKQLSPSPRAWTAWHKLLRLVSNRHGVLYIPHRLSQWTTSGDKLCHQWPFLYSINSNSLYSSFKTTFEVSGKVPTRVFSFSSN
jgi:hypothetical protein